MEDYPKKNGAKRKAIAQASVVTRMKKITSLNFSSFIMTQKTLMMICLVAYKYTVGCAGILHMVQKLQLSPLVLLYRLIQQQISSNLQDLNERIY